MARSIPNYGRIRDDEAVAVVRSALGERATIRAFGAPDGEPLKGYAERQIARGNLGVFTHLAGLAFESQLRPPFAQRRGVCVGCGTARAIEDSWLMAIAQKGRRGRPVRIDAATIYAGCRTQRDLGNGRFGKNQDGAIGSEAAKWVHDHGAIEQRKVGNHDLRGLNEKLAVTWGAPRVGVPAEVLAAGKDIWINCCYCETAAEMLDCAYAGFALQWCDDKTFSDKTKQGYSRLTQSASHCTELLSAGVALNGRDRWIGGHQSWGPEMPAGPDVLKYADGTVQLRQGMCAVPLAEFDRRLSYGAEAWAFQVLRGWR
ncbi:MAG: hypothetical protein ACK5Q5_22470 [Planctomycetaceae bacterium]